MCTVQPAGLKQSTLFHRTLNLDGRHIFVLSCINPHLKLHKCPDDMCNSNISLFYFHKVMKAVVMDEVRIKRGKKNSSLKSKSHSAEGTSFLRNRKEKFSRKMLIMGGVAAHY
jgi:hypothetical protein